MTVPDPQQPVDLLESSRSPNQFSRRLSEAARARDQLITSSARRSSDCGIVSPSAFAVLRLITRLGKTLSAAHLLSCNEMSLAHRLDFGVG